MSTIRNHPPVARRNKTGRKDDGGKPRFELIDPDAELDLARVLTMGAQKYEAYNWRDLDPARAIGAMGRHFNEIRRGSYVDHESGLSQAAHLLANAMFLHFYCRVNPEEVTQALRLVDQEHLDAIQEIEETSQHEAAVEES